MFAAIFLLDGTVFDSGDVRSYPNTLCGTLEGGILTGDVRQEKRQTTLEPAYPGRGANIGLLRYLLNTAIINAARRIASRTAVNGSSGAVRNCPCAATMNHDQSF
jgi:hypothetical protein